MFRIQKFISVFAVFLTITFLGGQAPLADAQGILPKAFKECTSYKDLDEFTRGALDNEKAFKELMKNAREQGVSEILRNTLGCALKLGKIRLFMMPFFITYLIQFLLQVAGLIAVLFVVLGGYKYAVGGLIEDKEAGKKYILHALVGLIVALSAWMVVNFIQIALTS